MAKIGHRITMKDKTFEHACDQPFKQYSVVDHSRGLSKQVQFNMNACLLKSHLTVQAENVTSAQPDTTVEQQENNETTNQKPRLCCEPNNKSDDKAAFEVYHLERENEPSESAAASEANEVYSVSSHFKHAKAKKKAKANKRRSSSSKQRKQSGERAEAIAEIVEVDAEHQVQSESTDIVVSNAAVQPTEQPKPVENALENQQLQMMVQLTQVSIKKRMLIFVSALQTINSLGSKFQNMGQSFEEKLALIEQRHRELESKLAETIV